MKNSKYRRILIFIGVVVLITLCIQVYWNYTNYQQGKQQLLNEVQISLDNAVEKYYASGAQRSTRITLQKAIASQGVRLQLPAADIRSSNALGQALQIKDTVKLAPGKRYEQLYITENGKPQEFDKIEVYQTEIKPAHLDTLVGRILFSMTNDTLDLQKMDSLVQAELSRKGIDVDYGIVFDRKGREEQKLHSGIVEEAELKTQSKSTWLPRNASLSLFFTNETATILKANMLGIILSALLLAAVIGCLMFLLKIINDQKQLAELKNDLISNITHEFKTPISTISVAMEGIMHFNKANDPDKTLNYVKASNTQVEKLNAMVEKLLETATLSGNKLELKKEDVDLVAMLNPLIKKWQELALSKTVEFKCKEDQIFFYADAFHIENAFNNILDNAVKYGGENIFVTIKVEKEKIEMIFSDSGNSLTRVQANQIFDKFYRVPKGNTHDVKGFGIGLYYTREIIERHGGRISVDVNKHTEFIIQLPYA